MKLHIGLVLCSLFCLQSVQANHPTNIDPPTVSENLQVGSRGAGVKRWQQFLIHQGLMAAPTNGIYDRKTYRATSDFQTKYNLDANGIVEPKTLVKAKQLGYKATGTHNSTPVKPKPSLDSFQSNASDIALRNSLLGHWQLSKVVPGGSQVAVMTFHKDGTLQMTKEGYSTSGEHIQQSGNYVYRVKEGILIAVCLDTTVDEVTVRQPNPTPRDFHIKIVGNKLVLVPYQQGVAAQVLTRM